MTSERMETIVGTGRKCRTFGSLALTGTKVLHLGRALSDFVRQAGNIFKINAPEEASPSYLSPPYRGTDIRGGRGFFDLKVQSVVRNQKGRNRITHSIVITSHFPEKALPLYWSPPYRGTEI